jgi:multidrug resistance efflux pump
VQELEKKAEQRFRAEEQSLNEKLEAADRKISELQSKKEGAGSMLLSPEQVKELEAARDEKLKTRKRLREIKFESNKDIQWVGTQAKLFNIGLMPALVLLAAIGVFVYRENRRKAA